MPRRFNIAGPCQPELHYMVPPLARLDAVRRLVDDRSYFVVHAPRQSGKTTSMFASARSLTEGGRYAAAVVSVGTGSMVGDDIGAAERAILQEIRDAAAWQLPPDLRPPPWPTAAAAYHIGAALDAWTRAIPRPLVLFLDEVDSLQDRPLLSLLRQLHSGYPARPQAFPWSIALVGLRDVRDYKVSASELGRLGTSSPFNIKERSLSLRNFTRDEIADLYAQHTADTGQAFTSGAVDRVHHLTDGQPWLVNALARMIVEDLVPDRGVIIDESHVDTARRRLIQGRETHFESLAERLREDRVRKVIEPILVGGVLPDLPLDDLEFAVDLGLVRRAPEGGLRIANPIYAEIIPRSLARAIDDSMGPLRPSWLTPEGELDPERLLEAFLEFWRRHGEALMGASPYHETAPYLVLMAFLQRVENGGGRLHREFAIGSDRLDLLLEWRKTRLPIEVKVHRPDRPDPAREGLAQLDTYMGPLGLSSGWLIIFDRRPRARRKARLPEVGMKKTPEKRKVAVIRA
jgi:hypothetical protein